MDVIKRRSKTINDIKIDVNKKETDTTDAPNGLEYVAPPENNIASASNNSQEDDIKSKKTTTKKSFWEKISLKLLYATVFLLPIMVLPLATFSVASAKNLVIYGGGLLLLFFWLLSGLQKGGFVFPKSFLLFGSWLLASVWLVSSFFSGNSALSLTGKVYETDTFATMAFAIFLMFLTAFYFQSGKKVSRIYSAVFASAALAFLFQALHLIFGLNILPFNVFPLNNSNLIGGWGDFSIFFGFVALISLIVALSLEKGFKKNIVCSLTVISIVALAVSGSVLIWTIFSIFSFFVFIYLLLENIRSGKAEGKRFGLKKIFTIPFFVFVASAFFVGDGYLNNSYFSGRISESSGTSFVEVRPDWTTTKEIIRQSLKKNIILGSGPNTFSYNWMKSKPASVNTTTFWNARFSSGFGYLPSAAATVGILGVLAMSFFVIVFLAYGVKIFSGKKSDSSDKTDKSDLSTDRSSSADKFLKPTFIGAAYLWTFEIFYSPGIVILGLAFVFTGLLVGVMVRNDLIKNTSFVFRKKTKSNMIYTLVSIIFLFGAASLSYLYFQKFFAFYSYNKALTVFNYTGDIEKTAKLLERAAALDSQDEYYRALSEISLARLGQAVSLSGQDFKKASELAESSVGSAIKYASDAALKINSAEPANWMQLGRVYESIIPLMDSTKAKDAENSAINAYAAAVNVSPRDPVPFFAAAKLALSANKIEDARKYLQASLNIKPNFASALFLWAQIEARSGNLKEAILMTERAAMAAQNDPGIFFQLGLLYYQANEINLARLAFERAVFLDGNYANARYFLGLIYDKLGMNKEAVEQFENIAKTNPENKEVKKILVNLRSGKNALNDLPPPEKRIEPPISETDNDQLKKKK